MRLLYLVIGAALAFGCAAGVDTAPLAAADWPQWRFNSARIAATPTPLPKQLSPLWSLELSKPRPAWLDQSKLQFDFAYEPIVADWRMIVGSMNEDTVTAYDARDGRKLWAFDTHGPVRFAPLAWEGGVYFGSDDGYLYCLELKSGALRPFIGSSAAGCWSRLCT